jgi:protein TonB
MFETIFRMAAASSPRSDRKLRTLPVSLVLHGLALGAVAFLSVRTANEIPPPPDNVVFLQGSAPPPLLGGPEARPPAPQERAVVAELRQPEEAAPTTETNHASSDSPASEGDDKPTSETAVGDPNGKENGSRDGTLGSEGRDGPRVGDSQEPFVPGGRVLEPKLLYRVEPVYPEAARKAHLEGTVLLQAIIGVDGRVEDLQVVHSASALLDAAALAAVGQWRYRPATLNLRPVRVYLTVTVEFRLR